MADNLTTTTTVSTVANGTIIATDQIPGTLEQYQKIKLADGTADSTTMMVVKATAAGSSDAGAVVRPVPGLLDSGGTDMTDTTNHALKTTLMTAAQLTNIVPSSGLSLQRTGGQITSATTTTLVSLTSSQVITVYGLVILNGATANNLTFQDSTPTNLVGTNAVFNLAANQGFVLDLRADKWFNATASGTSLQLITSSTGPLTWDLYYTKG